MLFKYIAGMEHIMEVKHFMRDIYIRNVPDSLIESIDSKVKDLNESDPKGHWNRSKYIRMLMANNQKYELINYEKSQYDLMQQKLLEEVKNWYEATNKLVDLVINGETPQAMNMLDKLSDEETEDD